MLETINICDNVHYFYFCFNIALIVSLYNNERYNKVFEIQNKGKKLRFL